MCAGVLRYYCEKRKKNPSEMSPRFVIVQSSAAHAFGRAPEPPRNRGTIIAYMYTSCLVCIRTRNVSLPRAGHSDRTRAIFLRRRNYPKNRRGGNPFFFPGVVCVQRGHRATRVTAAPRRIRRARVTDLLF